MRKLTCSLLLAVAATFVSSSPIAFAGEPPQIPASKLPPVQTPPDTHPPHRIGPAVPSPGAPLTLDRLEEMTISGAPYFTAYGDLMRQLRGGKSDGHMRAGTSEMRTSSSEMQVGSLATPTTTVNATADAIQDVESAVAAVTLSTTRWTSTTFIKYEGGTVVRNWFSTTSNFSTFTRGPLPMPAGYDFSADPLMSVNPYTSGIAPKRMYCVGIIYNNGAPQGNAQSAIGVWRSDDGGRTWSNPTIAAYSGGGGHFLDKPAIAVSWHSGTLGYVYIAYIDFYNPDVNSSSVRVLRSTDGGLSFPTVAIPTFDAVATPQIAVNTSNGEVYTTWVNTREEDIRFASSTDFGVSFGAHEKVAEGEQLRFGGNRIINGNVRAQTVPSMRYNWAAGKLMIVWHAGDNNTTDLTQIRYSHRPCTSQCNYWGWELAKTLNDVSTNDQFMPAIDFFSSGNSVVTFYDRRNTNNILYDQYMAYIDGNGNLLEPNKRIGTIRSNPQQNPNAFIGDYQDVWVHNYSDGQSASNAWVGTADTVNPTDVFLSRIFP